MKPFTAVVLAGERQSGDPVAEQAGASCKAMVPIGGSPMVFRVLDALREASEVGSCLLCGPRRSVVEGDRVLAERIASQGLRWLEGGDTPSTSALLVLESLPPDEPVLVTTADHALLTPEMVDHFCREARRGGRDVVAAVARHEVVSAAYPGTRRTVTRLQDGGFCGCNLFAFLTPRARAAADFWRQVEQRRKTPVLLVRAIGWGAVVRYLLGRLTLHLALRRLSERTGIEVGVVEMPFPDAAVDVDSVEDRRLVESIVARRGLDPATRV